MAKPNILITMENYNGATDILTKLKTVDGPGSGLDADLLDGLSSAAFATSGHTHTINGASITDVSISSLATNDILQWNGTSWVNKTITGAGALPLSGGSLSGPITMRLNSYWIAGAGGYGINMNNSDLVGANCIIFADETTSGNEGIFFPKTGKAGSTTASDYDTIAALDGKFYFNSSTLTTAELGYLSGTTSSIQTQLNSKLALSGGTLTGSLTFDTSSSEKIIKGSSNWGMYLNSSAVGWYDWANSRAVLSYTPSTNTLSAMSPTVRFAGVLQGMTNIKLWSSASGSGNAASSWVGFYDYDGGTRRGWVGDGSTGDTTISLYADTGDILIGASTQNIRISDTYGARIDTNGGEIRIYNSAKGSADTGIRLSSTGGADMLVNSVVKHSFSNSGTKIGGSMEVDGVTYGMSPVDNPRSIIEDIIIDIEVEESGTVVPLDYIYAKMITPKYAVFPSNGKVEVVSKNATSFTVKGYTGVIDIKIVGVRKDCADQYFPIMNDIKA